MKPFHQGKLDVFCAMYAVLNGLKLTHNIRTLHARDIFHETILQLAATPDALRVVLKQETNFVPLVDGMLSVQQHTFPLRVEAPFTERVPTAEQLWDTLEAWFRGGERRTAVFRFLRFLLPGSAPINLHWTTARGIHGDTLHFFDCSHEECAVYSLQRDAFVTREADVCEGRLICIEPQTVRLMGALHDRAPA